MKKTCVLMPGNPANARQYHSWMEEIESQHPELNTVYFTSYVLFSKKFKYAEYDVAMRGHYEKMLLNLPAVKRGEKVIIIAHSVGSYFALRLLQKYPEKIEKVIVIFPYLWYSTIPSMRFVGIPYMLDLLFPVAELVARCRRLIQIFDKEIIGISRQELTACLRFGVRQCVYFNKCKFDKDLLSAGKEKIVFIYKDDDRWCPEKTIELMKTVSTHKKVALPHDFITAKEDRVRMQDELAFNLKSYGNHGAGKMVFR